MASNNGLLFIVVRNVVVVEGVAVPCKQTLLRSQSASKKICALAFDATGSLLIVVEGGQRPVTRIWSVEGEDAADELAALNWCAESMDRGSQSEASGVVSTVALSTTLAVVVLHNADDGNDVSHIQLWLWRRQQLISTTRAALGRIHAAAWSPIGGDDNAFFTLGARRHASLWSVNDRFELTCQELHFGRFPYHHQLTFTACCIGCEWLFAVSSGQATLLCQIDGGRRSLERWVDLRASSATALDCSASIVCAACSGGIVRLFDATTLQFISTLQCNTVSDVFGVAIDGGAVVALTSDSTTRWRHVEATWEISKELRTHRSAINQIELSDGDSDDLFTCSSDASIRRWRNLVCVDQLVRDGAVLCMHVSGGGEHCSLAAGQCDGGVSLVRVEAQRMRELHHRAHCHDGEVLCVDILLLLDGFSLVIASAGRDRCIQLCHLQATDETTRIVSTRSLPSAHSATISALRFVGNFIFLSGSMDKSIVARHIGDIESLSVRSHDLLVLPSSVRTMCRARGYAGSCMFGGPRRRVAQCDVDKCGKLHERRSLKLAAGCTDDARAEIGTGSVVDIDCRFGCVAACCSDRTIGLITHGSDLTPLDTCTALLTETPKSICLLSKNHLVVSSGVNGCLFVYRVDYDDLAVDAHRTTRSTHSSQAACVNSGDDLHKHAQRWFSVLSLASPGHEKTDTSAQLRRAASLDTLPSNAISSGEPNCYEPPPPVDCGKRPTTTRTAPLIAGMSEASALLPSSDVASSSGYRRRRKRDRGLASRPPLGSYGAFSESVRTRPDSLELMATPKPVNRPARMRPTGSLPSTPEMSKRPSLQRINRTASIATVQATGTRYIDSGALERAKAAGFDLLMAVDAVQRQMSALIASGDYDSVSILRRSAIRAEEELMQLNQSAAAVEDDSAIRPS